MLLAVLNKTLTKKPSQASRYNINIHTQRKHMLVNKSHTKGDVVTIKLTSDTEIITRFISQDENGITIEKPMAVQITQQGLGLMPWLFSADASKEITIANEKIFCTMDTLKDLADQYIEGTTGISLAKA